MVNGRDIAPDILILSVYTTAARNTLRSFAQRIFQQVTSFTSQAAHGCSQSDRIWDYVNRSACLELGDANDSRVQWVDASTDDRIPGIDNAGCSEHWIPT